MYPRLNPVVSVGTKIVLEIEIESLDACTKARIPLFRTGDLSIHLHDLCFYGTVFRFLTGGHG